MHSDTDIIDRIRELHREFGRTRSTPEAPRSWRGWLRRLVFATKVVCSWSR